MVSNTPHLLTLTAHFDGKAIVPDEPLVLPYQSGARLKVTVEMAEDAKAGQQAAQPSKGPKAGSARGKITMAPDFDAPLDDFAPYMS